MIELKDGRYFKAIMQFEFKGTFDPNGPSDKPFASGNLLAAIFTDDPERKKWVLLYRFRYYVDDVVGLESEDPKSWYSMTSEGEENELFNETRAAFEKMAAETNSTLNVTIIESDAVDVQMEKIQASPNMHTSNPIPDEQWN